MEIIGMNRRVSTAILNEIVSLQDQILAKQCKSAPLGYEVHRYRELAELNASQMARELQILRSGTIVPDGSTLSILGAS